MKKGQAAMEFLMTYGWAILVVIAAIAALAYFGLNPTKVLPSKCMGSPGMACVRQPNINANASTISFVINNGVGYDINITGITKATGDCSVGSYTIKDTATKTTSSGSIILHNGDQAIVTVSCSEHLSGRTKAKFKVSYHDVETGFNNSADISITGNAK